MFDWLQQAGQIDDIEMLRTFNCGIGLCLIVDDSQLEATLKASEAQGIKAWHIGRTMAHNGQDVVITQ